MKSESVVTLRYFEPGDQDAAKDLILAGLAEHWGERDLTLNPDLNDIATSYADAVFIVGELADRIIGVGALVPRSDEEAEIVRMSVDSDLRRSGIGRQILQRLCDEGRQMGFSRIILETTVTWDGVIAFYQRFGFQITHYEESPFGRDVYFALDLKKTE